MYVLYWDCVQEEESSAEDGDDPGDQGDHEEDRGKTDEEEYSDEKSDEEVPTEKDELQKRVKDLKKVIYNYMYRIAPH